MIITCPAIFWRRRINPVMPRKPDTLANTIMMLCASKMLGYFGRLDQDLNGKRELKEKIYGQKSELSKLKGVDGKERAILDVVDAASEEDGVVVKVGEMILDQEEVVHGQVQKQHEQPGDEAIRSLAKGASSSREFNRQNIF